MENSKPPLALDPHIFRTILPYHCKHDGLVHLTEEAAKQRGGIQIDRRGSSKAWHLWWGMPELGRKGGVMESGFFRGAAHIDTVGLYKWSSLNTPAARDLMSGSDADLSRLTEIGTKFAQPLFSGWRTSGCVVLALQHPTDRSVLSVGNEGDYYRFVKAACTYYGKKLFLKLHPWNLRQEAESVFTDIANQHGCTIGMAPLSIIEECDFCLLYNSSFAVDCMRMGVRVAQFAPGYFYQTGAVYWTKGTLPHGTPDTTVMGFRLVNFLLNYYCFDLRMPLENWWILLDAFAGSTDMFPLPRTVSYASQLFSAPKGSKP